MANLNKIILIGRLIKDVEKSYTPSGACVAKFAMAINEYWKDKNGEKQESVEFVNIVVWNKMAETCDVYIGKGSQVYIEGKLKTRSWDKSDGTKAYMTEVVANTVQFLDTKEGSKKQSGDNVSQPDPTFTADDIPF